MFIHEQLSHEGVCPWGQMIKIQTDEQTGRPFMVVETGDMKVVIDLNSADMLKALGEAFLRVVPKAVSGSYGKVVPHVIDGWPTRKPMMASVDIAG